MNYEEKLLVYLVDGYRKSKKEGYHAGTFKEKNR